MSMIRIVKRITSDTLHLPELSHLVGRDVEILIREAADAHHPVRQDLPTLEEFVWREGTIDDALTVAASAPSSTTSSATNPFGGFDASIENWRDYELEIRARGQRRAQMAE